VHIGNQASGGHWIFLEKVGSEFVIHDDDRAPQAGTDNIEQGTSTGWNLQQDWSIAHYTTEAIRSPIWHSYLYQRGAAAEIEEATVDPSSQEIREVLESQAPQIASEREVINISSPSASEASSDETTSALAFIYSHMGRGALASYAAQDLSLKAICPRIHWEQGQLHKQLRVSTCQNVVAEAWANRPF
jgi:hypothetical protein